MQNLRKFCFARSPQERCNKSVAKYMHFAHSLASIALQQVVQSRATSQPAVAPVDRKLAVRPPYEVRRGQVAKLSDKARRKEAETLGIGAKLSSAASHCQTAQTQLEVVVQRNHAKTCTSERCTRRWNPTRLPPRI